MLKDTRSGWIHADMWSDNAVSYNWRSRHVAPWDVFKINAIDLLITGILYTYYSEQTMKYSLRVVEYFRDHVTIN